MTFSGRFLLSMIQFAVSRGANLKELLIMSGHDYEFLCNEESRVEPVVYNRIVEHSVLATKDDLFGFHAGEYLNLAAAGLIGQISQTSSTVKEALNYCCEFSNLGCQALPMKLKVSSKGYRLDFIANKIWEKSSPIASRQTIEGIMVFTLREFHLLTSQKYYPLEVGFTFSKPSNYLEYERLFKCPIMFNSETSYLLFSNEHVDAKVVSGDFNLLRILVQYAEQKLLELSGQLGFSDQVKRYVMNLVQPSFPTIEIVSSSMNMSVRSLQRKLKEENETYKSVIESIRKEMAINYLNQDKLNIKEISDLLNYSDSSGFSRSFKKWTGLLPSEFRKDT